MNIVRIISIILIIIIFLLGIEFFVKVIISKIKKIEDVRNGLLFRIGLITSLIIIVLFCNFLLIFFPSQPVVIKGIDNYNKNYYIEKYGEDLDSNLSIFPEDKDKLKGASFSSSLSNGLFDIDGYILLVTKYSFNDFEEEINRIKNLNMSIKNSCFEDAIEYTNYIKYDEESYKYPAYITIDGFDDTYEYCLINKDELEIIYVYIASLNRYNSNYKKYLKKDKSLYSKTNTIKAYSMYNHSFNNRSFMEFDDCK